MIRRSYTEADLAEAAQALAGHEEGSLLLHAESLGLDPEVLLQVAVGTAGLQLDEESGLAAALTQGAISFMIGFLMGVWLERREDGARELDIALLLPTAARMISRRGRHAVIADCCDLSGVALTEQECATVLAGQVDGLPEERRAALHDTLVRLFESGLATGLALPGSAPARPGAG